MNQPMSRDEMLAMLEAMKAENAALKAKIVAPAPRALSWKVSEKGAISIYGLGRFPVTLYRGQLERLLAASKELGEFIETNAHLLAVKS